MNASVAACLSFTMLTLGTLLHLTAAERAIAIYRTSPPRYGSAPCPVTVSVWIIPIETDRQIAVELDGPDYYRSSAEPIEGQHAAKAHDFFFRDVPAGEYRITAAIGTATSIRARAWHDLTIIGP